MVCKHEKVMSRMMLLSSPPQQPWICRLCGEEGRDVIGAPMVVDDEYEEVKKKFTEK